jgi:hypothetical protein
LRAHRLERAQFDVKHSAGLSQVIHAPSMPGSPADFNPDCAPPTALGASGHYHQPTAPSPSPPLEERAGERRPSRQEVATALVCHRVCAPLPAPRWQCRTASPHNPRRGGLFMAAPAPPSPRRKARQNRTSQPSAGGVITALMKSNISSAEAAFGYHPGTG